MSDTLEHEIRELRSLYWNEERDPEGRAFAPLADAYRRAGDLDQALELLDDGLSRHPDFTSGHLVSAWVHQARGDEVEAESAYRTVLQLDGDNASALYGLGRVLAARGEETGVEMVMRAQELDPLLRRSGAGAPAPARQPAVAAEESVMELTTLAPTPEDDDAADVLDMAMLSPDTEDDSDIVDLAALAPDASDEDDDEVFDMAMLSPDTEDEDDIVDLAALSPDSEDDEEDAVFDMAMLSPDSEDDEEDAVFDMAMLSPDSEDDIVDLAALAPEASDEDEDEDAVFDMAMLAPDAKDEDEVIDLAALAPESSPAKPAAPVPPPGASDAWAMTEEELLAEGQPEHLEDRASGIGVGVMTRTMAELLVKQGLGDRAVEIYERLVADKPDDHSLAARLEELREMAQPRPSGAESPSTATSDDARHEEIADSLVNTQPDPHGMTPFAWTEDEASEKEAAPAGPRVGGYFSQLLSWPAAAEASPGSNDDSDDSDEPDEDDFFNARVDPT